MKLQKSARKQLKLPKTHKKCILKSHSEKLWPFLIYKYFPLRLLTVPYLQSISLTRTVCNKFVIQYIPGHFAVYRIMIVSSVFINNKVIIQFHPCNQSNICHRCVLSEMYISFPVYKNSREFPGSNEHQVL